MAFGAKTVFRLDIALLGLIPSATVVLLLSGLAGGRVAIGGAILSFMGFSLGNLAGMPFGHWLETHTSHEADRRLPLVLALIFLPLALTPAKPTVFGYFHFGFHGWLPILAGVALALPLGIATGWAWAMNKKPALENRRSNLIWTLAGLGLGTLIATGAALTLSMFKGAFLVNLFTAPLVWPTLPVKGERSVLVRMLLTMVVVLSTMFLLFL